jgi:hypothetical protein
MIHYRDYYWRIDDGRIWSSAKTAYVAADDADYLAWLDVGNAPGRALDESGAVSAQGLREALRFYGLPLGELSAPDDLEAAFSAAVTARLDSFAALKQYDSITSARLAALSEDFAADGQIAKAAYDSTWTAAIALMPDVRAGTLSVEQALEQLPALAWPRE